MKKVLNVFVSHWGLFIVLALSFFAILPFFDAGFFPVHDDTQVVRVHEISQALKEGQFPVRWVKDLGYGYGYPLFNFYAPLPYYVGGVLTFFFDALASTKIMMVLGVVLSGIFMYLLAKEFWGEIGGVISGLFYVYAPYHALDIYVRGAVGEYFAIAFTPLLFYGLWRKWVLVGALGFAGIITSHNLTAMMVAPFIIIAILFYCYIAYKNKNLFTIHYSLFTILLGFGLSAFYFLPALFEMQFTNVVSQIGGNADFRNHFVCIAQLWDSTWGFGGSSPGCLDGLSFKIGKLHIIVSIIALAGSLFFLKKDKIRSVIILLSTFYFLLSIFMTLEVSKPVWELTSPLAYLQYPWRFLLLTAFSSSLMAGSLVLFFQEATLQKAVGVVLIAFLMFFNVELFKSHTGFAVKTEDYTNEEYIKWTTSKISDEYMPKNFQKPKNKDEIVRKKVVVQSGEGEIIGLVNKTSEITFSLNAKTDVSILARLAYFPAWKAFVDAKEVEYQTTNGGLVFDIPAGNHEAQLVFSQTPVERAGNFISVGSVLFLSVILLRMRKEKTK